MYYEKRYLVKRQTSVLPDSGQYDIILIHIVDGTLMIYDHYLFTFTQLWSIIYL